MDDMRRTIIALALLSASMGAHAASYTDLCRAYSDEAYTVMMKRHFGFTADSIHQEVSDAGNEMTPMLRRVISGAYKAPMAQSMDEATRTAEEYGEKWFARCMENRDG